MRSRNWERSAVKECDSSDEQFRWRSFSRDCTGRRVGHRRAEREPPEDQFCLQIRNGICETLRWTMSIKLTFDRDALIKRLYGSRGSVKVPANHFGRCKSFWMVCTGFVTPSNYWILFEDQRTCCFASYHRHLVINKSDNQISELVTPFFSQKAFLKQLTSLLDFV